MTTQQPQKGGAGPTIGILIILVVLLLGAFYFWGERLNQQARNSNPPPYIPADTNININATSTLD